MGRYGRAVSAAAVAGVLCLISGCGLVGGPVTLRQDAPDTITVTSPMVEQGLISPQYTCHGAGTSPPILWSVMPSGTRSIALVVDDAAAPAWGARLSNPDARRRSAAAGRRHQEVRHG